MAAQNVNVWFSGWRATGNTVNTPQYEVTVRYQWTDDAGVTHEDERTVRFPNVLAQLPAAWVKEEMQTLLLKAARKINKVDG